MSCSGVGPGEAKVVQELGCSCKGRGGRKQVNLLSGSQYLITNISEMGIGSWGTMLLQGKRLF